MILPIEILLTYTLACIAVVIVPGPSVTVIIANSLRHGTRAGLWTDVGTQAGLATMLIVLAAGLSTIVNHMGWVFDWLRLIGAAYLIWLGVKLFRGGGAVTSSTLPAVPGRNGGESGSRFFWQGFLVLWSNPEGAPVLRGVHSAIHRSRRIGTGTNPCPGLDLHRRRHDPGQRLGPGRRPRRPLAGRAAHADDGTDQRQFPDRRRALACPQPADLTEGPLPPVDQTMLCEAAAAPIKPVSVRLTR